MSKIKCKFRADFATGFVTMCEDTSLSIKISED